MAPTARKRDERERTIRILHECMRHANIEACKESLFRQGMRMMGVKGWFIGNERDGYRLQTSLMGSPLELFPEWCQLRPSTLPSKLRLIPTRLLSREKNSIRSVYFPFSKV